MIRPLSAHFTKQISSENLTYSNEQNPQITNFYNKSHTKNKTEYYRQQSDYIINKQQKLIQLLISVRLLQMGFDWRDNIRQIQKKMHQNRDISIQDVPRIVNQLIPQLINNKNRNNEQTFSVIPHFELKRQSRNDSSSSLKRQRNMKKKRGAQIILVGKQLKLCPICCIQTYEYIKLPCQHTFCKSCIIQTIKQDLNTARYDAVCPDYGCGTPMPDLVIEQLLEKNSYDRLLHFRAKQALQRNPHNKFCSIPDCGQLLESKYNHLQCKKCKKQYCKHCLQQVHENNCDQQLLKKLRSMYEAHKIKKCPKCKAPIQKIDGCNHMTCAKCQYGFCWICLGQYTDHHYRYYNCFGCPGMQFEDQSQIAIERVKQVCFFIFLPLLLLIAIICLLIFLPIFIIMTFLLKPCSWASEYQNKCQTKLLLDTICCCCCSDSIKTFLAYFILLPRSLIYAVFIAPFHLLCLLFNEIMGSMY